jgi:crotonobetainyl-CoA:carnitine CoA-transferase CaiB-like acyl-CoA transferase
MQNQLFRMSATPGRIRWPGRAHGRDTAEVLARVGVDAAALTDLRARGVA